jgi:hypothetical protein
MTHSPNDARDSHAVEATMIKKDVASVLKGLAQRRSEALYAMLVSQSVFERLATSSSTTAKLTPSSGWRTTALHAERAE